MHLQRQDVSLPVVNINEDDVMMSNNTRRRTRHSELLPNSIRCIICATSNGGKTNLMLNLLYSPLGLKFENIYLFSKTLFQPGYNQLSNVLKPLNEIGFYQFTDSGDVPLPCQTKPNSIMIFDDIACEKQERVRMYFSMGRHSQTDSFYLAQSYCRIPKHLVRDCANLIVVFRQDMLNMKKIYDDHVNMDMTLEKFKEICLLCWDQHQYGFLVIDKECSVSTGRYRQGFDTYIIP